MEIWIWVNRVKTVTVDQNNRARHKTTRHKTRKPAQTRNWIKTLIVTNREPNLEQMQGQTDTDENIVGAETNRHIVEDL